MVDVWGDYGERKHTVYQVNFTSSLKQALTEA